MEIVPPLPGFHQMAKAVGQGNHGNGNLDTVGGNPFYKYVADADKKFDRVTITSKCKSIHSRCWLYLRTGFGSLLPQRHVHG